MASKDLSPCLLERDLLRKLRLASLLEATTLLLLVLIAVPLKHLCDVPQATLVMGPAHGLAFIIFSRQLGETAGAGSWSRREGFGFLLAACIPFGGFLSARRLRRRELALACA